MPANRIAAQQYKRVLEAMRDDPFVLIVLPRGSEHFQLFARGLDPTVQQLVEDLVAAINA